MAQRGRCGLLRCLLLLALADLEANPDRRRIRNLVRMWDCPYLPGCMAAARSKIGRSGHGWNWLDRRWRHCSKPLLKKRSALTCMAARVPAAP